MEVVRLRGSEAEITKERDRLQNQVTLLKHTISLSSLPLPRGLDDLKSSNVSSPTISYLKDDLNHERFHVTWPAVSSGHAAQSTNFYSDAMGSLALTESFQDAEYSTGHHQGQYSSHGPFNYPSTSSALSVPHTAYHYVHVSF